jgi:ADP-dependent NAD(P)H-hydrate dehydratase / NAD(P)H-hydrate epimerase
VKIFSVSQIRSWDAYTIKHEPVISIELMERAAKACYNWILHHFNRSSHFAIFCGKGNNGGDGMAIARLLIENKYKVSVYIIGNNSGGSPDFIINLERLKSISSDIHFLENEASFPAIKDEVIIDALLGTGLNKRPMSIFSSLINHINKNASKVISIDIPSGLYTDKSSKQNIVIKASHTLTFQNQKLAFLMPENEASIGEVFLMDIQLSKVFEENENSVFEYISEDMIRRIYIPRTPFANKGNYGYACLVAGRYGMMGAAVLSAKACLRSGVGKLTCYTCKIGYNIMQTSVPEAMCTTFGNTFIKEVKKINYFDVIGIGPGIGEHSSHKELLRDLFRNFKKPVVIDADALNMLSEYPLLYQSIPSNSIITPHPKEFERLFGKSDSDFERINVAMLKAKELNIFIVLKGHFTFIATPQGKGYFNSTGNSGMATAGSGDVLTGIITGLLAQKYSPLHACILGVYIHGLSGDIAADQLSKESLIAGDIIHFMGNAFHKISES